MDAMKKALESEEHSVVGMWMSSDYHSDISVAFFCDIFYDIFAHFYDMYVSCKESGFCGNLIELLVCNN